MTQKPRSCGMSPESGSSFEQTRLCKHARDDRLRKKGLAIVFILVVATGFAESAISAEPKSPDGTVLSQIVVGGDSFLGDLAQIAAAKADVQSSSMNAQSSGSMAEKVRQVGDLLGDGKGVAAKELIQKLRRECESAEGDHRGLSVVLPGAGQHGEGVARAGSDATGSAQDLRG